MATLVTLATLGATGAAEEQKPPTRVLDAEGIQHGKVTFKSGNEEIDGYLARPEGKGKRKAVLVVAGNRISEEYIPNTCAALAVAGYVGLAPNIFHTIPESARTPEEVDKALEGRTDDDFVRDIRAGAEYLKAQAFVKPGGMGIVGFCSGGRRAMLYAAHYDDVRAVVAYHPALMNARGSRAGQSAGPDTSGHGRSAHPGRRDSGARGYSAQAGHAGRGVSLRRRRPWVPGLHSSLLQARRRGAVMEPNAGISEAPSIEVDRGPLAPIFPAGPGILS